MASRGRQSRARRVLSLQSSHNCKICHCTIVWIIVCIVIIKCQEYVYVYVNYIIVYTYELSIIVMYRFYNVSNINLYVMIKLSAISQNRCSWENVAKRGKMYGSCGKMCALKQTITTCKVFHTRHILPPSEIDVGLFWAVFTGTEGKHLFHRVG